MSRRRPKRNGESTRRSATTTRAAWTRRPSRRRAWPAEAHARAIAAIKTKATGHRAQPACTRTARARCSRSAPSRLQEREPYLAPDGGPGRPEPARPGSTTSRTTSASPPSASSTRPRAEDVRVARDPSDVAARGRDRAGHRDRPGQGLAGARQAPRAVEHLSQDDAPGAGALAPASTGTRTSRPRRARPSRTSTWAGRLLQGCERPHRPEGLEDWRPTCAGARWTRPSPLLPAAFVNESFAFNDKLLRGTKELRPRLEALRGFHRQPARGGAGPALRGEDLRRRGQGAHVEDVAALRRRCATTSRPCLDDGHDRMQALVKLGRHRHKTAIREVARLFACHHHARGRAGNALRADGFEPRASSRASASP